MRNGCLIAVVALLSGCMREQTLIHAACTMASMRENFATPSSRKAILEMEACRILRGYQRRYGADCPAQAVYAKAACYQPSDWIGWIGFKIENSQSSN